MFHFQVKAKVHQEIITNIIINTLVFLKITEVNSLGSFW